MDCPTVAVLLATFNGEQYLSELLASLTSQTHQDWQLHVRDDGSSDATLRILEEAAAQDARIMIIRDSVGNLGTSRNFGRMLKTVDADYLMLADQDDVWMADKIECSLALLRTKEAAMGTSCPVLVFSDLCVTDESLRTLHPSHMRRHGFHQAIRHGVTLHSLITQNFAPGCTMMFNRALRDMAVPIPDDAVMHDWWLMLCAAAAGTIVYLDRPTILYRQHGGNQMGAAGQVQRARAFLRSGLAPYLQRQRQSRAQVTELLRRFHARMRDVDVRACRVFAELDRYPRPLRQFKACRQRLGKCGWMRNIAFYALM